MLRNTTIQVFEEAFIQLKWYTEPTPVVKLNKETGEPRVRTLLFHKKIKEP
jgi:hypothetical protein